MLVSLPGLCRSTVVMGDITNLNAERMEGLSISSPLLQLRLRGSHRKSDGLCLRDRPRGRSNGDSARSRRSAGILVAASAAASA